MFSPVQEHLRWRCDREKADEICNFNRYVLQADHDKYLLEVPHSARYHRRLPTEDTPSSVVRLTQHMCILVASYFCSSLLLSCLLFLESNSLFGSIRLLRNHEIHGGSQSSEWADEILWFKYRKAVVHCSYWSYNGRIPCGERCAWMAELSRSWGESIFLASAIVLGSVRDSFTVWQSHFKAIQPLSKDCVWLPYHRSIGSTFVSSLMERQSVWMVLTLDTICLTAKVRATALT